MDEVKGEVADGADRDDGPDTWAEQLLDQLRPGTRDLRRVVDWLAAAVRGTVCLRDDAGTLLAGSPMPLDDGLVAELVAGRVSSAALEDGGRHLRLVGVRQPHPSSSVLAVSREAPFDRRTSDIVTHTAGVVELLLREREMTTARGRLERATADLRLAILQLLMVEDTVSARRVAAGLWPGLLDTDSACVYVVEGGPEGRDRLAEECQDATDGHALVVRCPARDQHLIVVVPARATEDALRALIGRRPHTYLGGSVRQSLAQTATAYGQAISALAVAHFRPDRAAVYAVRTRPERLIEPAALHGWTGQVLRPLDSLPHHTRAELLATTRLGLEFTAVDTAKILGVSRNTVRARMERVERLLGTDFDDLTARAAVHLALNTEAGLTEIPRGPAGHRPAHVRPARLADLLAGPAVRTWARELLGRVSRDGRNLRGTLRAWIAAGGNAERAAQGLGIHPQTVREHVRAAEPVLERQLLAGGSDLYEVVLAHLALGDLSEPALNRTNQGHSGRPVHE
ncbi:helix-turn-helix domain-containing protein [Streptomyces sp. NPDC005423]|uniref:helix-turn-helix domain-containing protein n=1 Tax=Streptomyces sp. NPDC005423 TaxID=3155343 RepID=UPI0033A974AD